MKISYAYIASAIFFIELMGQPQARSERQFQKMVEKHDLLVAYFYDDTTPARTNKIFESVSKTRRYAQGGVAFVAVNIDRRKNEGLQEMYTIRSLPMILLFYQSEPVEEGSLAGKITSKQVRALMESKFGEDIKKNIETRRLQQTVYRPVTYFDWGYPFYYGWPYYGYGWGSPGWGAGWPYGGYGGYGRPYIGFSVGF